MRIGSAGLRGSRTRGSIPAENVVHKKLVRRYQCVYFVRGARLSPIDPVACPKLRSIRPLACGECAAIHPIASSSSARPIWVLPGSASSCLL